MSWTDGELGAMVAGDIPAGSVVNLGIGLPLVVSDHIEAPGGVLLHSENGIFGLGPPAAPGREDPDVVNAGKQHATLVPGAAITDQVDSFAIVRAGYLDVAVLGAYQVSARGDLANWKRPGQRLAGVGGAADIAAGAGSVWVMMTAATREGDAKLLRECTFPLTAERVVRRVYTHLAVVEPVRDAGAFRVVRIAPGTSRADLAAAVDADLI